jgi:cytochrome c-type biogenesis protein CcmH/NrfG
MKRSQLFMAIGALLLVGLLFMLPKVIVSKDGESNLAAAAGTANRDGKATSEGHLETDAAEEDVHATATPEHLAAIAGLRNELKSATTPDQKLTISSKLAEAYTTAGKFDSAGYYFEQVAIAKPVAANYRASADQYFQAYSFAATEERAKELGTKTRAMYEQVLKLDPKDLDAKSNLAMTYVASDNPMQGITMLREVLQQDPENENALYQMGILSVQSGQHAKAVERFRKLTEVNPKHVNGNFYLGVSLAETGKKQEAIEVFKKVKTLSNDPALQTSVEEYLKKLGS